MNEDSVYASTFGKNLFCFVWSLLFLLFYCPVFTLLLKDTVYSEIIDFERSVVTHLVVALISQWEELGEYRGQVVRTGAAL